MSGTHVQTGEQAETHYSAFGVPVRLSHAADPLERDRRLRWLHHGAELFLASRAIPRSGLCVEVGAGEGWFSLPFACAFPDWQVLCLEPDAAAVTRLEANVAALGLRNVTCLQAGLHPDLPDIRPAADRRNAAAHLAVERQEKPFQRLVALGHRAEPVPEGTEGAVEVLPALPASALAGLEPDLLVFDAPGAEAAIAETMRTAPTGFLLGQLYAHVRSGLFNPADETAPRQYYLECGEHVLRRDFEDNFPDRRPRLDVVVAMYNTREFIEECVDSVLADGNPDIRVLVVNDGSSDGCEQLVAERYAGNPRVVLLNKPNGGCASARNYGRQKSDASHIAFIDADDRVDPGLFSALLEVARHTGTFVAEGEFQFFHPDRPADAQLVPSYEAEIYTMPGDRCIGPHHYTWIPGDAIAVGQPTIWRRIYRRDFLDRKKIYFPEHIRAFDDQIFQLLVAQYCGALAHVQGHSYHYRQHTAQDIKQGDERHFYSFNMFRAVILRSLDESWPRIDMVVQSLLNTMGWSYSGLRNDLKGIYREAAAAFVTALEKTYGYHIEPHRLRETGIEGLDFLVERRLQEMQNDPVSYGIMRLEDWRWQPELIRMMQSVRR
ncbi:hypothetical protein AVJ23_19975 [Pseudoponticoccus marisrubri]|uniref:tRNA (guanine(46)-N(7))-methyltransferase n=2 Tax=Pseudoponticoccus marisrubri TaxID=1685382 RepID=A0A0W7WEH6_9RHOB|nr:hypothetical protein AVJ23_19975 [Pseudoponticoccus marisrubri]